MSTFVSNVRFRCINCPEFTTRWSSRWQTYICPDCYYDWRLENMLMDQAIDAQYN